MPRTIMGPLQERKLQEARREQKIQHALESRKKALESEKRSKQQKKKTVGELFSLLNITGIAGAILRSMHSYVPRSHNLEKQLVGLLNHMFVRYPVPAFMYQACLHPEDPLHKRHGIYRQWFVTLAQGGSFSKLVRSFMTGKEAHLFLSAPACNQIHENMWWAKMRVAGLPVGLTEKLIDRIFGQYYFEDSAGRLAEIIRFYARYYPELDKVTFGEVTDFLAWKLRHDLDFSLQGRTAASVVKLTNAWHTQMQKAKLGHDVAWKGLELSDWEFEAKDKIWMVSELRNNKELLKEGQKQKHCVYSYVSWCVDGRSAICSLRSYRKAAADVTSEGKIVWDRSMEIERITIEVNSQRSIVQVRGPLNRLPTEEEKFILRLWAGEKGLLLRS